MSAGSFEQDRARLLLVEERIRFFGSPELRRHYTSLLRELEEERRRLRVRIERALNPGA